MDRVIVSLPGLQWHVDRVIVSLLGCSGTWTD